MSEAAPSVPAEETENHKLVELMGRVHAEETFATPESSLNFLKGLDYDQFEDLLTRVNGICREIPTSARTLDGRGNIQESNAFFGWSIPTYSPPAVEDRRLLMQEAFKTAQTLDDSEQAATLLGLSINIIHPFNDGNGRTSRLIYSLLSRGYNGSAEDSAYYNGLLTNTEGRKVADLNPENHHLTVKFNNAERRRIAKKSGYEGLIPHYGYGGYNAEFVEDQDDTNVMANDKVSPEARKLLHRLIKDDNFEATVFFDFLLETGKDPAEYLKSHNEGKRITLQLNKLVPELSDEDILHLADKQDELKKRYAEAVIGVFEKPENQAAAAEWTEFYRPKPDAQIAA